MKKMTIVTLVATLVAVTAGLAQEELVKGEDRIDVPAIGDGLCVHNLFQSGMVLQRDKPIPVWGWTAPGETVTVSFGGQTQKTTAAEDRAWKVTFTALPANTEPQQLIVRGKDGSLTLENILIGDIWVLGGQSNMEFPLAKLDNGRLEIVSANFDNIRHLTVPKLNGPEHKRAFPLLHQWSGWHSRHMRQGYWDVCTPETVRELSGMGYVFARRIHMATQVPMGVLDVSRGGTTVETWTPLDVLKKIDTPEVKAKLAEWDEKVAAFDPEKDLQDRIKRHEQWVERMKKEGKEIPPDRKTPTDLRPGPVMDQNKPGNCYTSMIAPIAGFPVKGAIFHQGFNNALGSGTQGARMYYQVFADMIAAWRKAFNDPSMPFGIISLCTAGQPQDLDNYVAQMSNDGIYIREAQYKTFLDLRNAGDENVGFASSFDQRRSWYHPQIKIPVGERIARWALATQYGMSKDIKWEPPRCEEMRVEDGRVLLKMNGHTGPYHDGPILGFAIAGEDRKFQPAKAEWFEKGKDRHNRPQYDRGILVLSSPLVPKPVHYRYAWGRNPLANLKTTDHTDIPFATQRSDDWTLEETYEAYTGKKPTATGNLDHRERGELSKALRAGDLRRHLYEAEELLKEHGEKKEE
jgi:sialate O-acetylesterase